MTDNKDSDTKISAEDQALWDEFTQERSAQGSAQGENEEDFEALLEEMDADHQKEPEQHKKKFKPAVPVKLQKENKQNIQAPQLDRRTADKLRKGKIQIEARLDLHGQNQSQAYEQLKIFIEQSIYKKQRCVLIITGKGKSRISSEEIFVLEKGILKQKVPEWLADPSFSQNILKISQAHPKDGGSGALYVYLKRQR